MAKLTVEELAAGYTPEHGVTNPDYIQARACEFAAYHLGQIAQELQLLRTGLCGGRDFKGAIERGLAQITTVLVKTAK